MPLRLIGKGATIEMTLHHVERFGPGRPFVLTAHATTLRAYWEGLRNGPNLPRRDQIDPRELLPALEHVFLLEHSGQGQARFRVAGVEVSAMAGQDLSGAAFALLFDPAARDRVTVQLQAMFQGPSVLDVSLLADRGTIRAPIPAHMVVLPLISRRGIIDQAIGCLDGPNLPALSPRRYRIERMLREPLPSGEPPPDYVLAPPIAGPILREPGQKPHLRLIQGGIDE